MDTVAASPTPLSDHRPRKPEKSAFSSQRWKTFFRYFFLGLLVTMSLAQWLVPVWVVSLIAGQDLTLHPSLHVIIPICFFILNLTLLRSSRRITRWPTLIRIPVRLYFSYVFTSAFCLVFLLLIGAVWGVTSSLTALVVRALQSPEQLSALQAVYWDGLRLVSGLGLLGILLSFVYGYTEGQRTVRLSHLALPLLNWPTALHGLKIVHLSDLHIGPNLTTQELRSYVQLANQQTPDIICITGDLLDSNPAYIPDYFPLLNNLQARYGVFACLGNHDHYAGASAIRAGLSQHTQITLLLDETARVKVNGSALHIIGLDDRGKDWARGLEEVPLLAELCRHLPQNAPRILLSHRPDLFPQAERLGIALTLSGHTHGGQFALPGWSGRLNLARFITNFSRGPYQLNRSWLYVNRGLGVTGQKVRLFTPRDIAVLSCQSPAVSR